MCESDTINEPAFKAILFVNVNTSPNKMCNIVKLKLKLTPKHQCPIWHIRTLSTLNVNCMQTQLGVNWNWHDQFVCKQNQKTNVFWLFCAWIGRLYWTQFRLVKFVSVYILFRHTDYVHTEAQRFTTSNSREFKEIVWHCVLQQISFMKWKPSCLRRLSKG